MRLEIKTKDNGHVDYLKLNDELIGYGIKKMNITLEAGEIKVEAFASEMSKKYINTKLLEENNIELYVKERE